MRRWLALAFAATMMLALLPLGGGAVAADPDPDVIPGSYIVVLESGSPGAVAAEHSRSHNASVTHVYRHALRGYAARMSDRAASRIARDRRVAYVEADGVVTTSGDTVQTNATWGLDRIDQRELPLEGTYQYAGTGKGVTAYIIDTGIRASHADFGSRVTGGMTAISDGRGTDDCNGHGTHVAGTVGGATWGVAKGVTLVPVRVLDCSGSGSWTGVIAGLDWVAANNDGKPAVANMSLGGGANTAVDEAVQRTIGTGIPVAVAAGNGNRGGREQDACGYSPARVQEALTVGATTSSDSKTSWSNYGNCVDLFAPGAGITSAWHTSNTDTRTISGTSMASPHVAGVAALYLEANASASSSQVFTAVYENTTKNIVTSSRTDNNHLLYSLFNGSSTEPPPPNEDEAPTASFTYLCTDLACSFTDTSKDGDGQIVAWSWTFGEGEASSTEQDPSHEYADDGTYTVTLTVTDDEGATGTVSDNVTVADTGAEPTGVPEVTLQGSSYQLNRNFWRGEVIVTAVVDGQPAEGLAVSGTFSPGGSDSCTTGVDGTCVVDSGNLRNNVPSTTFTLDEASSYTCQVCSIEVD